MSVGITFPSDGTIVLAEELVQERRVGWDGDFDAPNGVSPIVIQWAKGVKVGPAMKDIKVSCQINIFCWFILSAS
jgi:hypothetical protein